MRKYKSRNREKLIEQANQNSLTHLLKDKQLTTEDKQKLIAEHNPLLFIFGERLNPHNHYDLQDYNSFINHQYLGEVEAQSQGEYYGI